MEFDTKRFLKLAGLPDHDVAASAPAPSSAPRPLVESARRAPARSADEQKLRSLIRREAQRMISERAAMSASPDVSKLQQKKSLTEAITLGFAGIGFGGKNPVLGGPMTSAKRFASLEESMEEEKKSEGDDLETESDGVGDDEGDLVY